MDRYAPVAPVFLLGAILLSSCSKSDTAAQPTSGETSASAGQRVVFRSSDGRQLTENDIANATEKFDWAVVGGENVSERAKELHAAGREEGQKGNYVRALELFKQAAEEAPAWPYPVYDAAFTYLLQGDAENADRFYQRVNKLAPRGFFTAKTAVDCLRRERNGDVIPGTYKAYVALEWVDDKRKKRAVLEQIVKTCPKFPPAWKELAVLRPDDPAKLAAIEHGLSQNPDGETKGILLINKAIIMDRQGKRDAAMEILGDLALDPESTLATESLAKFTLRNVVGHK
jgi:tetratricopeptide (TPR) repeat protein